MKLRKDEVHEETGRETRFFQVLVMKCVWFCWRYLMEMKMLSQILLKSLFFGVRKTLKFIETSVKNENMHEIGREKTFSRFD